MTIRSSRSLARVAAVCLALATVPAVAPTQARAEDPPDPFGPAVTSLPFRSWTAPAAGSGTAAANAAVTAACNGGKAIVDQRWYRLTASPAGLVFLRPQRLVQIGAARAPEETLVGAATVDLATGEVLGCGQPEAIPAGVEVGVVAFSDADYVADCALVPECSLDDVKLLVNASAGAPANDSVSHPTVIDALPYSQTVDTSLADSDGPNVMGPAPLSDLAPEQANTVWWQYTPTVTGLLPVESSGGLTRTDVGLAEVTPSGPVVVDWWSTWDYDYPLPPIPVTAGKTYLIGAFTRYDSYYERPIVFGGPLTLNVGDVKLAAPTDVHGAATSETAVHVGWTPPAGVDPSAVTAYRVRAFDGDGSLVRTVMAAGDATDAEVTGLVRRTGYTFDVTAMRGDVEGVASARSDVITTIGDASSVANLRVTAEDGAAGSVTVAWDPPAYVSGTLTGYRVALEDGAAVTLPLDRRQFTATGLAPWSTLWLTVTPLTSGGEGESAVLVHRLTSPVPTEPVQVLVNTWGGKLTTEWQAPEKEGSGGPVQAYVVRRYDSADRVVQAVRVPATQRAYTFGALRPGTLGRVSVAAVNAAGEGLIGRPPADVTVVLPPAALQGLRVLDHPYPLTARIAWTPTTSTSRPEDSLVVSFGGTTSPVVVEEPGVGLVVGLPGWARTTLRVRAENAAGAGPSAPLVVRATGYEPAPVRDLKAVVSGDGEVDVTWTASEEGYAPVERYDVKATPAGVGEEVAGSVGADTTAFTLTGLTPGTTYDVTVTAVDAGQTPGVPTTVKVRAAGPPTAPAVRTPVVTGAGDSAMATVSWQSPRSNGGSRITGWVVTLLRIGADGSVTETLPQEPVPAAARSARIALPGAGRYAVTVHALNAAGAGTPSARSRVVTVPVAPSPGVTPPVSSPTPTPTPTPTASRDQTAAAVVPTPAAPAASPAVTPTPTGS